ncbi:unnamed protein product [Effrenium voratum]|uniref:Prolyl 4-hydroxylase alpha subunit domain-containing protein n=1 Tax=Effrenium voratum TaxID=2562239 RepID=A0AA36J0K7_9DINO|nr:unnamed protein product [Effrenium voratum]
MAEEKDSKATLGEEIIIDPAEVVGLDDEKPLQDDVKAGKRGRVLKAYNVLEDPEVIVVPDFVNEAEIQHLLQLAERGWQPSEVGSGVYKSKDEAKDLANEVSDIRTSYSCLIEPGTSNMVTAIEYRLATLAGMDVKHLEPLNMVRYAPGQFFKEHHDGRFRPKTVFLYLNDVPPGEGGETMFPDLNVKIVPRRGCAVMWSNIIGPQQEDNRMVHQGLPPKATIKYGVNCFFNDKPMRRFVEGEDTKPKPSEAKVSILDPLDIVQRCPVPATKDARADPDAGLRLRRLRVSQDPALWLVPDVISSREAGQLMDMMDRQQGRTPAGGFRVEGDEDLQELLADLEARLAAAAGLAGQASVRGLELRRLPAEASGGARVVSAPEEQKPFRAVYLFLHDLPDGGQLLFPKLGRQVTAREGFAAVWDPEDQDHLGLPPKTGSRYGISCTFLL